jgi:aromatic ring-opening dioxygenase catalytic subunit (LigB family)
MYTHKITKLRDLQNSLIPLVASGSMITNLYLVKIKEFAMEYWMSYKT